MLTENESEIIKFQYDKIENLRNINLFFNPMRIELSFFNNNIYVSFSFLLVF